MIRIAISSAAFEAIAGTLPLGSVGYEAEANQEGERLIWLEDAMADRLFFTVHRFTNVPAPFVARWNVLRRAWYAALTDRTV